MNRIIRLLAIVLLLLFLAGLWIWWNRPTAVDMTAYVPADSLVYLEANSLTEITAAMSDTEAWRNLGPLLGMTSELRPNRLTSFVRATGIGSTASVIASRCQLAVVMLDLNSTSKDSTLNYKPLAALVIETHTSSTRIRSTIEDLVGSLARRSFGQPAVERITEDGHEFVKWTSVDRQRQIVVTIDGSVAIIANDIRAAAACLESRAGRRPSLAHQADVEEMRKRVRASGSLAFGYVSAASAARLLSVIAPARLGKLADEPQFQKLMTTGSAKVLGNIGWSTRAMGGGIEDYYFMTLKSDVAARLQPALSTTDVSRHAAWELLPADVYSVSNYNFADPALTWQSLNGAISSQLDALSAFLFAALSKGSFAPYGIDEPDSFLRAVEPELLTAILDPSSERSVVIATIRDETALRQLISRQFGARARTEKVGARDIILSTDEHWAASFLNNLFMLGSPEDVRRCLAIQNGQNGASFASVTSLRANQNAGPTSASVVSFAQDSDRVRAFLTALARLRGANPIVVNAGEADRVIKKLPYAVTETKFEAPGFERRTRSPLGQFGNIVSLLAPDSAN